MAIVCIEQGFHQTVIMGNGHIKQSVPFLKEEDSIKKNGHMTIGQGKQGRAPEIQSSGER
jgi:hypothetical protein